MENHKLVLPEDLNHFGFLFGGRLLQWVDEYAWIAASLDHPTCRFVTIGMDKVEFKKSVRKGSIIRFDINMMHSGNTSVRYEVSVFNGNDCIFCTTVAMVNVDEDGNKQPFRAFRETYHKDSIILGEIIRKPMEAPPLRDPAIEAAEDAAVFEAVRRAAEAPPVEEYSEDDEWKCPWSDCEICDVRDQDEIE